jgi:hypothetical protein
MVDVMVNLLIYFFNVTNKCTQLSQIHNNIFKNTLQSYMFPTLLVHHQRVHKLSLLYVELMEILRVVSMFSGQIFLHCKLDSVWMFWRCSRCYNIL